MSYNRCCNVEVLMFRRYTRDWTTASLVFTDTLTQARHMNVSQACQYHGSDLFVQGMYGLLDCASKHFADVSTEVGCTGVDKTWAWPMG